jgi:hypothetical protein
MSAAEQARFWANHVAEARRLSYPLSTGNSHYRQKVNNASTGSAGDDGGRERWAITS